MQHETAKIGGHTWSDIDAPRSPLNTLRSDMVARLSNTIGSRKALSAVKCYPEISLHASPSSFEVSSPVSQCLWRVSFHDRVSIDRSDGVVGVMLPADLEATWTSCDGFRRNSRSLIEPVRRASLRLNRTRGPSIQD